MTGFVMDFLIQNTQKLWILCSSKVKVVSNLLLNQLLDPIQTASNIGPRKYLLPSLHSAPDRCHRRSRCRIQYPWSHRHIGGGSNINTGGRQTGAPDQHQIQASSVNSNSQLDRKSNLELQDIIWFPVIFIDIHETKQI